MPRLILRCGLCSSRFATPPSPLVCLPIAILLWGRGASRASHFVGAVVAPNVPVYRVHRRAVPSDISQPPRCVARRHSRRQGSAFHSRRRPLQAFRSSALPATSWLHRIAAFSSASRSGGDLGRPSAVTRGRCCVAPAASVIALSHFASSVDTPPTPPPPAVDVVPNSYVIPSSVVRNVAIADSVTSAHPFSVADLATLGRLAFPAEATCAQRTERSLRPAGSATPSLAHLNVPHDVVDQSICVVVVVPSELLHVDIGPGASPV